jgi:hypothetical protein
LRLIGRRWPPRAPRAPGQRPPAARRRVRNRIEQATSVTDQGNAEILQVIGGQTRQHLVVDLVLAESLLVSLQPEPRNQPPMSIVSSRRSSSAHSTRERYRVGAYDAPEVGVKLMSHRCIKGRRRRSQRVTAKGREPSSRLGDCEGSTALARGGSPDVGNWHAGGLAVAPARVCLLRPG